MIMISNVAMVPFIVGILFVVFSILCIAAIFVLCYNWALYFMKNLNLAPSPSSHQQQITNPNGSHQIIPTQLDFFMKLDEVCPCPPIVYMPGEARPTFIAFPLPYNNVVDDDEDINAQLKMQKKTIGDAHEGNGSSTLGKTLSEIRLQIHLST